MLKYMWKQFSGDGNNNIRAYNKNNKNTNFSDAIKNEENVIIFPTNTHTHSPTDTWK